MATPRTLFGRPPSDQLDAIEPEGRSQEEDTRDFFVQRRPFTPSRPSTAARDFPVRPRSAGGVAGAMAAAQACAEAARAAADAALVAATLICSEEGNERARVDPEASFGNSTKVQTADVPSLKSTELQRDVEDFLSSLTAAEVHPGIGKQQTSMTFGISAASVSDFLQGLNEARDAFEENLIAWTPRWQGLNIKPFENCSQEGLTPTMARRSLKRISENALATGPHHHAKQELRPSSILSVKPTIATKTTDHQYSTLQGSLTQSQFHNDKTSTNQNCSVRPMAPNEAMQPSSVAAMTVLAAARAAMKEVPTKASPTRSSSHRMLQCKSNECHAKDVDETVVSGGKSYSLRSIYQNKQRRTGWTADQCSLPTLPHQLFHPEVKPNNMGLVQKRIGSLKSKHQEENMKNYVYQHEQMQLQKSPSEPGLLPRLESKRSFISSREGSFRRSRSAAAVDAARIAGRVLFPRPCSERGTRDKVCL